MARDDAAGWSIGSLARVASVVLGAMLIALAATLVGAQALDPPPGSVVRVANTDGATLNLRAGPSPDEAVAAELAEGDLLTVAGAGRTVGDVRWLPVRTADGQPGWVSSQYAAVVSTPTPPTSTPLPSPVALAEPAQEVMAVAPTATPPQPVEVEARLKYPDSRQREQEVTIWVSRGGVPVPGATVYMTSDSGDDEVDRVLDLTDDDGRTRRVFSSKKDKGTINLTISAVAPDGGEGKTTASYFRH